MKQDKALVTGSLTVKNEIYQIVLSWRENGNRKQQWISTKLPEKGNYREATRKLKEAIEQKEEQISSSVINNYDPLFSEYIKEHFEMIKHSLQDSTYVNDRNRIYNFIVPYFEEKGLRLKEIRKQDLIAYVAWRMNAGNTFKTAKKHIVNMSRCFAYAVESDLIQVNPALGIKDPSNNKKKQKGFVGAYLTRTELNRLISKVKGSKVETPILFGVYYGLRRSEIIGLKWQHIDFVNSVIHIENKVVQIAGVSDDKKSKIVSTSELKSNASYRTLPLVKPMREHLLALKIETKKNMEYFGNAYNAEYLDYICVNAEGNILKPNYVTKKFKDFMIELRIEKPVTFHGLRHSCATMLLELGYTIKDIQGWLGHSSYQITADIYAHADVSSRIGMGKKIEEILP